MERNAGGAGGHSSGATPPAITMPSNRVSRRMKARAQRKPNSLGPNRGTRSGAEPYFCQVAMHLGSTAGSAATAANSPQGLATGLSGRPSMSVITTITPMAAAARSAAAAATPGGTRSRRLCSTRMVPGAVSTPSQPITASSGKRHWRPTLTAGSRPSSAIR